MHPEFLMGNEAIALGALAAGVGVACGYPGTPSTEVLETVASRRGKGTYVEWSVNEKAAMELAAGASYAGARTLVTCKQVGLNVAADPLMSLAYVGVKGGMVVVVADDPGPISSQTEQDTRSFAQFAKLPVFDPSTPAEAYAMVIEAFSLSERIGSPVIVRPTTRVDHGYGIVEVADEHEWIQINAEGFVRDPSRWVIFPRLSCINHAAIEGRNAELTKEQSSSPFNRFETGKGRVGIVTQGVSFSYVMDALAHLSETTTEFKRPPVLKIGTPFPFPESLALSFLEGLDEIICIEELDPFLEHSLAELIGRHHLSVRVLGKLTGDVAPSGENTVESLTDLLARLLSVDPPRLPALPQAPQLPIRPPVLCAGCPHRASFYAVKRAMAGQKCVFCGDIGCYTLGNAAPLEMVDTCLCMGAGITIAQGISRVDSSVTTLSFVGDSTLFASGITGIINAVYNESRLTVCVLDNSTTAMTGHQVHPGIGRTLMGGTTEKVDIEALLHGAGVKTVKTVDPLDLAATVETLREVVALPGVKAIIFRSPCVVVARPTAHSVVDKAKCIACKRCIETIGCPAISFDGDKAHIDETQCTGCTLCEQICPVGAISGGVRP